MPSILYISDYHFLFYDVCLCLGISENTFDISLLSDKKALKEYNGSNSNFFKARHHTRSLQKNVGGWTCRCQKETENSATRGSLENWHIHPWNCYVVCFMLRILQQYGSSPDASASSTRTVQPLEVRLLYTIYYMTYVMSPNDSRWMTVGLRGQEARC